MPVLRASELTAGGRVRDAPVRRRNAVGPNVYRVGLALALALAAVGAGATYWQVYMAASLSARPDNPLVIEAARSAVRGRILDARGVVLAADVSAPSGGQRRVYPRPLAAPFLGYASARYGTAGLEAAFDSELLGLASSPLDELLRKFRARASNPADLVLSIDMRLQTKAMALLGAQRGAIVAIDPATGRVLALASTPSYDPSRIVDPTGAAVYLQSLLAQTAAAPLLDRATQGRYVPGSIFKIVTASAALGSGAISPLTTYQDQPAEERTGFLVDGFRVTDGPKPDTGGPADFSQALAISSNIYFAHVGLATGAAALREWARRFGFEAQIPFDLPNLPSQVTAGGGPNAGFADQVELANAAYGQAETLVTPLQMALVAATIANGGTLMAPELVTELRRADGTTEERPPKVWEAVLEPPIAGEIRDAMVAAVESPLGQPFAGAAAVPGVLTAGKSGTAQLGSGAPHSWFIGFAPATSSRIAVAVLVEHGGAGVQEAVPIAGQLMAYALSLGP